VKETKIKAVVIVSTLLFVAFMLTAPVGSAKSTQSRPFTATAESTSVTVVPTSPTVLMISITAVGQATHMGRIEIEQHHFAHLDTGLFDGGAFVITAANGDTLDGSYSGYLTPTSVPGEFAIHGSLTFDGGTGRFADASGIGSASGIQHPDGTADLILDGTITY